MFEAAAAIVLLIGVFATLVGSIGLLRLPDFYRRLHAPTKATTLGVGSILIASMLYFAGRGEPSVRELLVLFFLFLSAPVSAYLLARAALRMKLRAHDGVSLPEPRQ